MDQFYRWVWKQEEGYTTRVTQDHANGWMRDLAQSDYSSTNQTNCQKAVKMLFKWQEHEYGSSGWEPQITFTDRTGSNPRDYITSDKPTKVRDAAVEYGNIPEYSNLNVAERGRWKQYLAQRFEKPKENINEIDGVGAACLQHRFYDFRCSERLGLSELLSELIELSSSASSLSVPNNARYTHAHPLARFR